MKWLNRKTLGVPRWSILTGVIVFAAMQTVFYKAGDIVPRALNIPWHTSQTVIDDYIPFVSVFVIPYLYSFIFWVMGFIAPVKEGKEYYWDYITGLLIALSAGTLTMIIFPTQMDRYAMGLYETAGQGPLGDLVRFVYDNDGGQYGTCLLPSFHCLASMTCILGVIRARKIGRGFKIYTVIVAVLIFMATVMIRQHFFMDIVFGIAYALIGYFIGTRFHTGRKIASVFTA